MEHRNIVVILFSFFIMSMFLANSATWNIMEPEANRKFSDTNPIFSQILFIMDIF